VALVDCENQLTELVGGARLADGTAGGSSPQTIS